MKEFTARALDRARHLGATYADIRLVENQSEGITVKNGKVEALSRGEDQGFGVRVLVGGAWGFASSSIVNNDELDKVVTQAVQIARASARVRPCLRHVYCRPRREQTLHRARASRPERFWSVPLEPVHGRWGHT